MYMASLLKEHHVDAKYFAWLDTAHTYARVSGQIAACLPEIRNAGLIGGMTCDETMTSTAMSNEQSSKALVPNTFLTGTLGMLRFDK